LIQLPGAGLIKKEKKIRKNNYLQKKTTFKKMFATLLMTKMLPRLSNILPRHLGSIGNRLKFVKLQQGRVGMHADSCSNFLL